MAESLPLAMARGCCENAVVGIWMYHWRWTRVASKASSPWESSPTWTRSIRVSTRWFAWPVPERFSLFSHRANWRTEDYRRCRTATDRSEKEGKWKLVREGEAESYLPNNLNPEEAALTIRIIAYTVHGIVVDALTDVPRMTEGAKLPYD